MRFGLGGKDATTTTTTVKSQVQIIVYFLKNLLHNIRFEYTYIFAVSHLFTAANRDHSSLREIILRFAAS